MMDELNRRLSPTETNSNKSLSKTQIHSNNVELDPITGITKTTDSSRKVIERVQADVEKLNDGSLHKHRYNFHEVNENNKTNRFNTLKDNSELPTSNYNRFRPSKLRWLEDDSEDSRSNKTKKFEPIGASLASELGIDLKKKPTSFNYEWSAKRRAHEALLREIDDEDEKFRTLPPTDSHRFKAKDAIFAIDWDPKELRYLSKEGRQNLIRPTKPYVTPEQPFKHKRKSLYGKWMEGF